MKDEGQTPIHDQYKVSWGDNDPANPNNFAPIYKVWITSQMAMLAFVGSFGASVISPAEAVLATEFNISREVTVLLLSLFVLGYAFGPMVWGPFGEVYGRKLSMLPAVFVLGLFSIGTATSKSAAAIFVTRFFGGFFASAPISNVSAAIGDFYGPKERGVPMALMAACVVGGPCLAPVVGAAIVVNPHMGWRWTEYIQGIITFFVTAVTAVCLPETYHPVLLKRKAQQLRQETGNSQYWHPHESEKINPRNVLTKYISRPLRMLFTEPIVTCIALYASYVYGLLFFQMESFPFVFYQERGYSLVISTLPFLGLLVGVLCALTINFANQTFYAKAVAKNRGCAVPEARLPPMLIGGIFFSAGMFWFGWTAAPRYSWVLPTVAAGFIGAGFNITFQQCLNFLVDTYGPFAASAMAGNTFLRSLLACGLPMAARPLFTKLGVGLGSSLLGGLSCLALPVPLIFMKYGIKLRKMSKFAQVANE
ncbi:bicyclomycin resistance protein, putative [Talaromyces stipitatus ATCC 10500]|uniref:Bicyclomycin resistance protein, putative n=1 Tax=Talaromyces stipitatus (strain ATCC 10500 / CBS 375.48 / QM 6759 / NRRL 1006) TaxID=441959 RepID=B8MCH4_TALSN|nr:bicyclomycin resistance protein, putative [Talaromyces stipitatus ATCC 10500]EED18790.1 bicyclomycin resistance protein, putative [Talaromyces stipitatus ATCC 10500]